MLLVSRHSINRGKRTHSVQSKPSSVLAEAIENEHIHQRRHIA
jgi:hypothetical protein